MGLTSIGWALFPNNPSALDLPGTRRILPWKGKPGCKERALGALGSPCPFGLGVRYIDPSPCSP